MTATWSHDDFSIESLLEAKREPVTVLIPARETAATIGDVVAQLLPLRRRGLVDELIVIDADSGDGTAAIAAEAGATVHSENELMAELGPARGKGDAMWRALSVAQGEIIVYLDGDIADLGAHYVTGLLGPLLTEPHRYSFVKADYRRPFTVGMSEIPDGGGRVTELTARPLLATLVPELGGIRQPLAGEVAATRDLLASIPYFTSYGVEIGMLVEVWNRVGAEAIAQVDLGSKRNAHQPLDALGKMAGEVIEALRLTLEHIESEAAGRIVPAPECGTGRLELRPPFDRRSVPFSR